MQLYVENVIYSTFVALHNAQKTQKMNFHTNGSISMFFAHCVATTTYLVQKKRRPIMSIKLR